MRLACARLLLKHTANAADARQQLERARLLLNTVRDGGGSGGGGGGAATPGAAGSSSFSVASLRCAVFSELASVHAALRSARAAADALARGSAAAAAAAHAAAAAAAAGSSSSSSSSSSSAAAWQAHFATRAAALASPLHGGIFASSGAGGSGGGGGDPLGQGASASWLKSAPPLAAAAVALARAAAAANEPGRAEKDAPEFVQKALRLLEEVELEAKREREREGERAANGGGGEEEDIVIDFDGGDDDGSKPKRRKSSAGDALPVSAAAKRNTSTTFPASAYPSRAAELAHAARLRAHAEALRVALSLSAGDPVAELGGMEEGGGGRFARLADALSDAVGLAAAARGASEAEEGAVAAAVAAAAASGGGARRRSRGGDDANSTVPPPLPFPASLAEDAEAAASAAGALATAAGVLRPLCKFIYAAVHLARGLEICDEGLARLGAVDEEEGGGEGDRGERENGGGASTKATLESSLPPHVSAAAAPLVRARLALLDSRARCRLSQSDLAGARQDVAAALAVAGAWPRAAAPLLAPLLLPLAGVYCLCARELPAARAFLGAAAAASGPRAYQLQAQRQQQQQRTAAATGTPENRSQASPAAAGSASASSSAAVVQPPGGPAGPAANAALSAAHAAFAELADPSPAGGGPAARATSVLKAGLAFPAPPPAGPGVPRTHRATAQLALGCTLAAVASAAPPPSEEGGGGGGGSAASAATSARARARTLFGSALAAAQRNLSNLQFTAFALGALAPLLAYDDGEAAGGGGGGGAGGSAGGGEGGDSAESAGVEAGRTLFIGAMDVAKSIDCPAAVLAATSGWVQQRSSLSGNQAAGKNPQEASASEAYIARYEAKRAARVAEAKGLAAVPETQDTEEALAEARAEHEAIVGWMPVCQ